MTDASLSPRDEVAAHVARKIRELSVRQSKGLSSATAELAALRRGAGAPVGADPDTWEAVLGLPGTLRGRGDTPSDAETAIHHALGTWAIHQRAKTEPMHDTATTFASAVARLARSQRDDPLESAAFGRFRSAVTAEDVPSLVRHCRGLTGQLRSSGIGFDYAVFARDLYLYAKPSERDRVRLRWGRDFSRLPTMSDGGGPTV